MMCGVVVFGASECPRVCDMCDLRSTSAHRTGTRTGPHGVTSANPDCVHGISTNDTTGNPQRETTLTLCALDLVLENGRTKMQYCSIVVQCRSRTPLTGHAINQVTPTLRSMTCAHLTISRAESRELRCLCGVTDMHIICFPKERFP